MNTAASLWLLKIGVISKDNLKPIRKEEISTATGIVDTNIYRTNVKILDITFKIEFIIAPISDRLSFKFLIGRNLMDQLEKKQTLLLKLVEE